MNVLNISCNVFVEMVRSPSPSAAENTQSESAESHSSGPTSSSARTPSSCTARTPSSHSRVGSAKKRKAGSDLEELLKQLNEQRKSDMQMMMSSFAEQTRQLTSGITSMFGEVLKAMKQPSASQQANCYPMSMGSHHQATSPSFAQGYSTSVSNTHPVIQPNYPASATSAASARPPTTNSQPQPSQPVNQPQYTQLQNAPATTDWTGLSRYTVGDLD